MCLQIHKFLLRQCSVDTHLDAVTAYTSALELALRFDESLPVALDTNVLLNELNLPESLCTRFAEFLKSNQKRLIIPAQVATEYQRYAEQTPDCFDITGLPVLTALSAEEEAGVIDEFKSLQTQKTPLPFPGKGDIKGKPDAPYGDFIIFHELLMFMKNEKTDLVFLTNDVFKGDWMTNNFLPHLELIETVYQITGRSLLILPASRVIKGNLSNDSEGVDISDYFSPTKVYKARFNRMWGGLRIALKQAGGTLAGPDQKVVSELRNVQRLLVLSDDITHNSYIDASWLYKMEQLSGTLKGGN